MICLPPRPKKRYKTMPRKKKYSFPFWLSERADLHENRFIQIGNSLLFSKAFQKLSSGAKHLYFCMAMESGGQREFTFPKSAGTKYGISARTLLRYIDELERNGFITKTVCGRVTREANQYSFCEAWRNPRPP